jgi:hypothetical protein
LMGTDAVRDRCGSGSSRTLYPSRPGPLRTAPAATASRRGSPSRPPWPRLFAAPSAALRPPRSRGLDRIVERRLPCPISRHDTRRHTAPRDIFPILRCGQGCSMCEWRALAHWCSLAWKPGMWRSCAVGHGPRRPRVQCLPSSLPHATGGVHVSYPFPCCAHAQLCVCVCVCVSPWTYQAGGPRRRPRLLHWG